MRRRRSRSIFAAAEHGHLVYPASTLHTGENRLVVEFAAGAAPLNRNADFLYTIFVPARAHEAFPCFDQPDLRGRFVLTLDLPQAWIGVANCEVSHEAALSDGRTTFTFAETAPIPTYLFAFAAGRLREDVVERD